MSERVAICIKDDSKAQNMARVFVVESMPFEFDFNYHYWFEFDLQEIGTALSWIRMFEVEAEWWRRDASGDLVPMDEPDIRTTRMEEQPSGSVQ